MYYILIWENWKWLLNILKSYKDGYRTKNEVQLARLLELKALTQYNMKDFRNALDNFRQVLSMYENKKIIRA